MTRLRDTDGMSLVEVLVVAVIVGVLAVLLIPNTARKRSGSDVNAVKVAADEAASRLAAWAADTEEFSGASLSRVAGLDLLTAAQVITGRPGLTSAAGSGVEMLSSATAWPSAANIGVFAQPSADGDVITVRKCVDSYFSSGRRLCAGVDVFPYGTATSTTPVRARQLTCDGCTPTLSATVPAGPTITDWPATPSPDAD